MSARSPRNVTPSACAGVEIGGGQAVALLGVGRAGDDDPHHWRELPEARRRLEHLAVALLAYEPPDGSDDDVVGSGTELGPTAARRAVPVRSGSNRSRSIPLPRSRSFERGTPMRANVSTSSGFWTSSASEHVAAIRSKA